MTRRPMIDDAMMRWGEIGYLRCGGGGARRCSSASGADSVLLPVSDAGERHCPTHTHAGQQLTLKLLAPGPLLGSFHIKTSSLFSPDV